MNLVVMKQQKRAVQNYDYPSKLVLEGECGMTKQPIGYTAIDDSFRNHDEG